MRSILKSILFIALFAVSFEALAAKNPVSWTLNRLFPAISYPGRTYSVTYTFTNQLPFTMVKPLVINKNATPASDFTYVDGCTGTKLGHLGSCTVKITLTPATTGNKSVQLIITGYSNDSVPVPAVVSQTQGDPVSTVSASVSQNLPSSLGVGIAGNYGFKFTNAGSSAVTNVSVSVTQTNGQTPTYVTDCTSSLSPGFCTVTGTYTPNTSSPSLQTVKATLNYGSSNSVSASTSTDIPSTVGVVASFIGFEYLPGLMVPTAPPAPPYPPYPAGLTVGVLFTNTGPGVATISSPTIGITSGAGTFSTVTAQSSCLTTTSLNVGAACQMIGVLDTSSVATFPSEITVTAGVTSSTTPTSVSKASTTNVISTLATSRTITFINNCGFNVWYSMNGAKTSGSCSAGCPTGTSCSTDGNCYWTNYPPLATAVATNLLPNSTPVTQTIPVTAADPVVQWSGNISASLGCTGDQTTGSCIQTSCSNQGGASCAPGMGFIQPATQAEFTLLLNGVDSYDVETINGFHIPISITPVYSVTPSVAAVPDNYTCNVAAGNPAASGFGVCDWSTASPPSTYYNMVTSNNNAGCASCPSSSTTQICGLDTSFNYGCGQFLGYWSADQMCSYSGLPASVQTAFGCNTSLASLNPTNFFPNGYTLYDLMSCPVPTGDTNATLNSCYGTYSNVPANNELQCCGCIDWWTVGGIGNNSNSNTASCTKPGQATPQTDPVWNNYIQNTVQWMKKACPSAYVYPFDDKTSTFTCTNTVQGSPNSTSYTITFCPNNNTGLPAGKSGAEGRV